MKEAKAAAVRTAELLARPLIARQAAGSVLQPNSRAYVTHTPPPDADMTQPPDAGVFTAVEPGARIIAPRPVRRGRCKCDAKLGRSGKCPALCQPLPHPLPKYDGPTMIGQQIGPSPVRSGPGWIG